VVAKLPVVPLVVTPEAALHACVSTPLLIEASTPKLSSPPRSTVVAKLLVVPLVVMPEATSHACVSTPSSIETSTPKLSSPSSNLSTAFSANLSACITKNTSSVVRKKAEYIDFCDSAQVKTEYLKYIKTTADLPIDQQTQISFLVRKFNSSAITAAFSMLIGKVAGAAPMAFFPLPSKKEDLFQQFLCLIYDTKPMMINTEEECYPYVKKYSDSEYFLFC
jgi:hypothetical protein